MAMIELPVSKRSTTNKDYATAAGEAMLLVVQARQDCLPAFCNHCMQGNGLYVEQKRVAYRRRELAS
jgi:hypothetical protein